MLHSPTYGVWALTEKGGKFVTEVTKEQTARGNILPRRKVSSAEFALLKQEFAEIGLIREKLVIEYEKNRLIGYYRIKLAFLAPDIMEAIMAGRQSVDLTAYKLIKHVDLPMYWAEQRRILGFN